MGRGCTGGAQGFLITRACGADCDEYAVSVRDRFPREVGGCRPAGPGHTVGGEHRLRVKMREGGRRGVGAYEGGGGWKVQVTPLVENIV